MALPPAKRRRTVHKMGTAPPSDALEGTDEVARRPTTPTLATPATSSTVPNAAATKSRTTNGLRGSHAEAPRGVDAQQAAGTQHYHHTVHDAPPTPAHSPDLTHHHSRRPPDRTRRRDDLPDATPTPTLTTAPDDDPMAVPPLTTTRSAPRHYPRHPSASDTPTDWLPSHRVARRTRSMGVTDPTGVGSQIGGLRDHFADHETLHATRPDDDAPHHDLRRHYRRRRRRRQPLPTTTRAVSHRRRSSVSASTSQLRSPASTGAT